MASSLLNQIPHTSSQLQVRMTSIPTYLNFIPVQDKDIYLLDDPFAAVDTHVASHIFTHCIMGILKYKTRILCTHQRKYLHDADVIVVMEHGMVARIGSPRDVLKDHTSIMKTYAIGM